MLTSAQSPVAAARVQAHVRSRAQKLTTPASKLNVDKHANRAGLRGIQRVVTSRVTHSPALDSDSTSSQQRDTCDLSAAAKPTCSESAAGSLDCSALVDHDLDTRWASQHRPAQVLDGGGVRDKILANVWNLKQ